MRRSLGTAVFSGMLGVTLFGIFLTPVFFYVIVGLGETPLFRAERTRRWGGPVLGGLLGLAIGFLLGKIGLVLLLWGPIVGALAGAFIVRGLMEVHRRVART
jgi:multidrug efflux pump